jgi:hypothetical protein
MPFRAAQLEIADSRQAIMNNHVCLQRVQALRQALSLTPREGS